MRTLGIRILSSSEPSLNSSSTPTTGEVFKITLSKLGHVQGQGRSDNGHVQVVMERLDEGIS